MSDYKSSILGAFCKGQPGPGFKDAWAKLAESEEPLWALKPKPDANVVLKCWRMPGFRPWGYSLLSEDNYRRIIEARRLVLVSLAADVSTYDAVLKGMGAEPVAPKAPEARSAQGAYEAYVASSGGKNYEGKPCPEWDKLPEAVRGHWAAVHAYYQA